MAHRGPDGRGLWLDPDGKACLGHVRLAIIETSAIGSQPMLSDDGAFVISFNGEIYNYRELGEELSKFGINRRGTSDTAVLLSAWQAWGLGCLDRLDGMFAFAVYDIRGQRLYLARDRAGEKPLYYRHTKAKLHVASELQALIALGGDRERIDLEALEHYLAWGYVQAPRSLLKGVSKLPPASYACLDLATGRLDIASYWHPPALSEAHPAASDTEIIDALDEVLRRAVRRQLVSDVPLGVLLSGGTDSSLVAAYAAESSPDRLKTFTVSFPGSSKFDESKHAKKVAGFLSTEHTEITIPHMTADTFEGLVERLDEPIADPSFLPTAILAQEVRKHVAVAVGGDGADELFGGYPRYSQLPSIDALRHVIPHPLLGALGRALRVAPQGWAGNNLLRSIADAPGSIGRFNVLFNSRSHHSLFPHIAMRDAVELSRDQLAPPGLQAAERAAHADFHSYLPDEVLVKVDRASMMHGLEVRAPFLDRSVLDFAFGKMPWGLKADRHRRKIALKVLAKRRLPQGFDAARKQGFTPPLSDWFGSSLKPLVAATVAHLSAEGFSGDALTTFARRPDLHANRLFALVALSLWMRKYRVGL